MAKYCTKCGKKLEEGEVCNCEEILQTNNIDFSGGITKLINLIKGLFTSPVKTLKEFKNENNFSLALIITVITSVFTSLFALLIVKNTVSLTTDYSYYGFGYTRVVEIPYFKYFVIYLILLLVAYFVQALIYYLVNNKIFKVNLNYKEAFNIVSALSIFVLAGVILAIITSVFTITLSMVFIVIAALFSIIILTLIQKDVLKLNDTKAMYSIITYYLITAVVCFLFILIFN